MAIQLAKDSTFPGSSPPDQLVKASNESDKKLLLAMKDPKIYKRPKNGLSILRINNKLQTDLNTVPNVWKKNITETTATESISVAGQTIAVNNMNAQSNQKLEELPEITDLDIEEVIGNIQNNQDVITDKITDFNVDSLLNDPYTL